MEFDDVCNTGLDLGINMLPKAVRQPKKKKLSLKYDHLLPSLTLGPPEDTLKSATKNDVAGKVCESTDLHQLASSLGALSSFSNTSVKKDRDFGDEEVELDRVSNSRVSEEDEDGSTRKKLRLNQEQFATLEESFKEHSTLSPKQKQVLAGKLNLRPRQVEVWFQNRRARIKLKQTEVDRELLKRCCETLTDENRRLQKELQELKSLNVSPPLYMKLREATLTICPYCERLGSGGGALQQEIISILDQSLSTKNPSAASC